MAHQSFLSYISSSCTPCKYAALPMKWKKKVQELAAIHAKLIRRDDANSELVTRAREVTLDQARAILLSSNDRQRNNALPKIEQRSAIILQALDPPL